LFFGGLARSHIVSIITCLCLFGRGSGLN
jgi:hypothetical protein